VGELRLRAEPVHGAEHEALARCLLDSEDALGLVTTASEQLALVTGGGFHGFPFVAAEVAEGVGNAPTSG
jgi:hypothetical protein